MASAVSSLVQTLAVSEVQDVIISEIVTDVATATSVRTIRIYGTQGTDAPALEIQLMSPDVEKLKVTLPKVDI